MVNRLKLFVFLAVLLSSIPVFAQEGLYFGGGLSVLQPTNNFGQDDYGFKTVAQTGGGVNASAIWFLNPQISLGAELGYAFVPRKKSYWSLLDKRGDYKVNYQMANLVALGSFYFNGDDVKPYLGVAFGAYYLRNLVDFDDKNTTSSVSYTYRSVHPGYGTGSRHVNRAEQKTICYHWSSVYLYTKHR